VKYTAHVAQVLKTGIHVVGAVTDGEVHVLSQMPLADRVEIVLDGTPDGPAMMYRYTTAGEFCGDTWHQRLQHAFEQAEYEYGLQPEDFHERPNLPSHEPVSF
jgi:hypothetical protein